MMHHVMMSHVCLGHTSFNKQQADYSLVLVQSVGLLPVCAMDV